MRDSSRLGFRSLLIIAFVAAVIAVAPFARADSERKVPRTEVPAPVLAAFEKAYPAAKATAFAREEKEGKTFYEIESRDGDVSRDLLFAPDGTLAEAEEKIPTGELPQPVRDAIRALGPKVTVRSAEKVTRGGTVSYSVTVSGAMTKEMAFDPSGRRLGK